MLRWIFSTLSRLAQPDENDADPWLREMRQADRYVDAGKLDQAEAILRPLLLPTQPDERRMHTLYMLGITQGRRGDDHEASALLEEAFKLTKAVRPHDTGRLVSTLKNWLVSLKRTGEDKKAADAEAQLRALSNRLVSELWTFDSDDWIHDPTGIRFPKNFGALHRADVGFNNPMGFDGHAIYTLKPPGRGQVIIEVALTDRSRNEGLIELSNRAVAMLGLTGADYKEGIFRAGLETAPTGIRRLWPFFEIDGENWNLETFFVARGQVHICIFKTCPPGDVIETGESLEEMLVQFDWPRPDG